MTICRNCEHAGRQISFQIYYDFAGPSGLLQKPPPQPPRLRPVSVPTRHLKHKPKHRTARQDSDSLSGEERQLKISSTFQARLNAVPRGSSTHALPITPARQTITHAPRPEEAAGDCHQRQREAHDKENCEECRPADHRDGWREDNQPPAKNGSRSRRRDVQRRWAVLQHRGGGCEYCVRIGARRIRRHRLILPRASRVSKVDLGVYRTSTSLFRRRWPESSSMPT